MLSHRRPNGAGSPKSDVVFRREALASLVTEVRHEAVPFLARPDHGHRGCLGCRLCLAFDVFDRSHLLTRNAAVRARPPDRAISYGAQAGPGKTVLGRVRTIRLGGSARL